MSPTRLGKDNSTESLKTFMSFLYDKQLTDMSTTINSSIELFNYCIPAREAVLSFYGDLFNEYSTYYWIVKRRSVAPIREMDRNKIDYVGDITRRFYEATKLKMVDAKEDQPSRSKSSPSKAPTIESPASPTASQSCSSPPGEQQPKIIPTDPKIIPISRRTSSGNSSSEYDQAPASPTNQDTESCQENNMEYEADLNVDIFLQLGELILSIQTALEAFMSKYNLRDLSSRTNTSTNYETYPNERQKARLRDILNTWATELLIQLTIKNTDIASNIAKDLSKNNPSTLLSNEIDLWLGNPVNKLLVDLLLKSHNNIKDLFRRLINSTQNSDWLIAHILLEMSKRPDYDKDFSSCMEVLTTVLPLLKLDLDLISQLLIDKLCAVTVGIVSVAQLIKLCCCTLERVEHDEICISTKHRLCRSLATCYFLLLEYETEKFPETLSHIRISLTCMSLLKQSSAASHILCRALLEGSLVHGHLFNENFNPSLLGDGDGTFDWNCDTSIKLSKENLKVFLGHRFRRLPNYAPELSSNTRKKVKFNPIDPDKPDRYSINCYLLIEAFKSSINNIEAFATLFVEFHCPVMFDKHSWPCDDALRVIDARNLSILRKFEQIPPFWDLYELIGQAGFLKTCLVLVKALLAAHLALWASATTNITSDKMISTSRLIPPLAQSGLVPKAFGLTVEVFPHLASNEVFSVLVDIWQYLKDTNANLQPSELSEEEKKIRAKSYLNRLRLFMCHHIPGPLYVKIFKEFYKPPPAVDIS